MKGVSELLLSKNGEVVKIEDPIHVAAYKSGGWVEVSEAEQVEEPEAEEPEAEQVEEKPKRVRKAKTE